MRPSLNKTIFSATDAKVKPRAFRGCQGQPAVGGSMPGLHPPGFISFSSKDVTKVSDKEHVSRGFFDGFPAWLRPADFPMPHLIIVCVFFASVCLVLVFKT